MAKSIEELYKEWFPKIKKTKYKTSPGIKENYNKVMQDPISINKGITVFKSFNEKYKEVVGSHPAKKPFTKNAQFINRNKDITVFKSFNERYRDVIHDPVYKIYEKNLQFINRNEAITVFKSFNERYKEAIGNYPAKRPFTKNMQFINRNKGITVFKSFNEKYKDVVGNYPAKRPENTRFINRNEAITIFEPPREKYKKMMTDPKSINSKNLDSDIARTANGEPYVLKNKKEKGLINNRNLPIQSSLDYVERTMKKITSPTGLMFLGKQFAMQIYNARPETRVYNPLSLYPVPGIKVPRAAGTELNDYESQTKLLEKLPSTKYNAGKFLNTKAINEANKFRFTPYKPQLIKNRWVDIRSFPPAKMSNASKGKKYATLAYGEFNKDDDDDYYPKSLPQSIYFSTGPTNTIDKTIKLNEIAKEKPDQINDLIPFHIYDVNNEKYIILRAFLTGLTESPTAEWNAKSYIGRPEKAYTYTGAERTFTFTVKLVAFSKNELKPLWKKINYILGLNYPTYTENKMMKGPIVELTLGSLYKDTPGFFNSIAIEYDDEFPWEVKYNKNFAEMGAEDPSIEREAEEIYQNEPLDELFLPIGATITFGFTVIGNESWVTGGKHVFGLPDDWTNNKEEN